jgi:HK97 family phage major capsid protein
MAVNITELRQKRQTIIVEFRKLNDEVGERGEESPEETEKLQKMDTDIAAMTRQIDREERLLQHEKEIAKSVIAMDDANTRGGGSWSGSGEVVKVNLSRQVNRFSNRVEVERHMPYALQGWLRAIKPDAEFQREHIDAAKFFNINLRNKEIVLPIAPDHRMVKKQYRDMSLAVAAGGYTIAEGFVDNLEIALLEFGGVRQVANTIRTNTGADLPWPTMNDTANKGVILAESTNFGSSVDPGFANVLFKAFKYSSKPIIVSNELLEDSAFDLPQIIGSALGTRIGRIQNDHFTTGAGTTLPKGLTVAGFLGKTAASMTVFTADEVIDLQHSIDPAYRTRSTWMFHDTVAATIRKLKETTTNAYIWQPGLQQGVPDRLLGDTYTINQSMASALTTGQKLILYGDFSKYQIRDVREIRMVRLDELFAATDQVGFIAFMRTDGNLLDAGTHPVKWLALA